MELTLSIKKNQSSCYNLLFQNHYHSVITNEQSTHHQNAVPCIARPNADGIYPPAVPCTENTHYADCRA